MKRNRIEVECNWCGNIIEKMPSQIHTHNFCNKECTNNWLKQYAPRGNDAHQYIERIKMVCDCGCGSNIFLTPKQYKITPHHFVNKHHYAKWYSKNLTGKNSSLWKNKIVVNCSWCGTERQLNPWEKRIGSKDYFCDKDCFTNWKKENILKGEDNPLWKERVVVKCDCGCGKDIIKLPSHLNGKHHFYNKECKSEWESKNKIGKNSYQYNSKIIKCDCGCGKDIERSPAFINNHNFYNHDCYAKWRSKHLIGENNPAYIHGESRRIYCYKFFGKNGIQNRSRLFFNNKCIECGKTKEENKVNLSVHHVYYRKMSCCENGEEYENGVKKVGNILYIKDKNNEYVHEIKGPHEKFAVLCHSCHGKTTSHDRLYWIKYYEDKINKLYNGKSYYTIKEYEDKLNEK